jgi:hypothetical protein
MPGVKPGHDETLGGLAQSRLFGRRLSQTIAAQAVLAFGRHRQSRGFLRAPAGAAGVAIKFGAAPGTGEAAKGEAFFPICHDGLRNLAAIFR